MSVCQSHLTSGASARPENAVTGSAGNKGQKICGVFSATALLPRSSAPSLGWPYIRSAIFFLRIIRMRKFSRVRAMWMFHAVVSSHRVLALRSFWGWRVLVRVVYLAGYWVARDSISGTVVLL